MKTLDDAPPPDCCVCDMSTTRVCWCHTGEVMDTRPCQCVNGQMRWPEVAIEIARRVIHVASYQVIGPPRQRRTRNPKGDPMLAATWGSPGSVLAALWLDASEYAPRQQGFGHMDKVAREMKT